MGVYPPAATIDYFFARDDAPPRVQPRTTGRRLRPSPSAPAAPSAAAPAAAVSSAGAIASLSADDASRAAPGTRRASPRPRLPRLRGGSAAQEPRRGDDPHHASVLVVGAHAPSSSARRDARRARRVPVRPPRRPRRAAEPDRSRDEREPPGEETEYEVARDDEDESDREEPRGAVELEPHVHARHPGGHGHARGGHSRVVSSEDVARVEENGGDVDGRDEVDAPGAFREFRAGGHDEFRGDVRREDATSLGVPRHVERDPPISPGSQRVGQRRRFPVDGGGARRNLERYFHVHDVRVRLASERGMRDGRARDDHRGMESRRLEVGRGAIVANRRVKRSGRDLGAVPIARIRDRNRKHVRLRHGTGTEEAFRSPRRGPVPVRRVAAPHAPVAPVRRPGVGERPQRFGVAVADVEFRPGGAIVHAVVVGEEAAAAQRGGV